MIDSIALLKASVMGIVEGLTEFVPISSTGHLILTAWLINFNESSAKIFEIAIQTGAMLAVIWQYRKVLIFTVCGIFNEKKAQRFSLNIIIAFLPAVVFGLSLGGFIQEHLFNPIVVSLAFISGGVIILIVEKYNNKSIIPKIDKIDEMTKFEALAIGVLQCFALIPGMSRSGSTIIGGMVLNLSRKCATEFSFYLGIPTLMGAGVYSVWKDRALLQASDLPLFSVGFIFSFISALICIRWLIQYVSSHDFKPFAWYRIAFGIIVLITYWNGWVSWSV